MRPSQYHYIKRMWTRYLYNRSSRKRKRSNIFSEIFRFAIILAFWPLMVSAFICHKIFTFISGIGMKHFFKICGFLLLADMVLSLLSNIAKNFSGFVKIGIIVAVLAIILYFVRLKFSRISSNTNENVFSEKQDGEIEKYPKSDTYNAGKGLGEIENREKNISKSCDSQYDIFKYAIMCNAYLEHQDEMEQYRSENSLTDSDESEK